ncbi:hypothetical protein D9619_011563 [Psilocybe cf. subviscida]|uniref:Uncharacterized protein n=1 Tax=Psilocybe cf. subviscida TaxID=2480587 RepID=A0A8H5BUU1_9AGAR|nr:hypothetical protein D9619_011563 [Psilocybe cf. subviscida]
MSLLLDADEVEYKHSLRLCVVIVVLVPHREAERPSLRPTVFVSSFLSKVLFEEEEGPIKPGVEDVGEGDEDRRSEFLLHAHFAFGSQTAPKLTEANTGLCV